MSFLEDYFIHRLIQENLVLIHFLAKYIQITWSGVRLPRDDAPQSRYHVVQLNELDISKNHPYLCL